MTVFCEPIKTGKNCNRKNRLRNKRVLKNKPQFSNLILDFYQFIFFRREKRPREKSRSMNGDGLTKLPVLKSEELLRRKKSLMRWRRPNSYRKLWWKIKTAFNTKKYHFKIVHLINSRVGSKQNKIFLKLKFLWKRMK